MDGRTRQLAGRFRTAGVILVAASISAALVSCEASDSLEQDERASIEKLLTAGLEIKDDPYVRSETLRVIEMLGDPHFNPKAKAAMTDSSAMVRVSALRVLLATGDSEAKKMTLMRFEQSKGPERLAVLEAAMQQGSEPLKRELAGRALRSDEEMLRRIAFELGHVARVEDAVKEGKKTYLESTLYPEIGRFVERKDPVLASAALALFVRNGQEERAEPLLEKLADEKASVQDRVRAGKILSRARVPKAKEAFMAILDANAAVMADNSIGVPKEPIDPELLRVATLGAAATGATAQVKAAQAYLNGAKEREYLEVLEALGGSESPEAAISLKIAMQHASQDIRHRSIELYQGRKDADPKALINATRGAPYETQRRLALLLSSRFKKAWVEHLSTSLNGAGVNETLQLLSDVVTSAEEAVLVKELTQPLEAIAKSGDEKRAGKASYLLALANGTQGGVELVEGLGTENRYAYLEFLVRSAPKANVPVFRKYFYDDLYVIRLMSAAGLWKAFGAEGEPEAAEAPPAE